MPARFRVGGFTWNRRSPESRAFPYARFRLNEDCRADQNPPLPGAGYRHNKNKKESGNIFRAVTLEGEEFLDPVPVVTLQLDGISLYRPATGKFSFHVF